MRKEDRTTENMYNFKNKLSCLNDFTENELNRTVTMFKYNNLPDSLPEREFELILQTIGKCIVAKDNDGNLVALSGNYAPPLNVYYQSTRFRVVNPWADINKEFEIGKDCVLVRNDPLDKGLLPIIWKYGALDVETNLTLRNATINMRTMFNIIASNDNELASAERYLKRLEDGEMAAMMNEEWSEGGITTQPYSNGTNGYLTQLIELKQYIKGSFINELGLNANYNMKRERLTSSETDLNEDYLRPLIDSMMEERQKAIDKINEMFGTNISVEFNSSWSKYNPTLEDESVEDSYSEEIENNDMISDEPTNIEVESNDEPIEETPDVEEVAKDEDVTIEEDSTLEDANIEIDITIENNVENVEDNNDESEED